MPSDRYGQTKSASSRALAYVPTYRTELYFPRLEIPTFLLGGTSYSMKYQTKTTLDPTIFWNLARNGIEAPQEYIRHKFLTIPSMRNVPLQTTTSVQIKCYAVICSGETNH